MYTDYQLRFTSTLSTIFFFFFFPNNKAQKAPLSLWSWRHHTHTHTSLGPFIVLVLLPLSKVTHNNVIPITTAMSSLCYLWTTKSIPAKRTL